MTSIVSWLLSPIVGLMGLLLGLYTGLLGSAGVAILLLSATFTAALSPLQRKGVAFERRLAEKRKHIDAEIASAQRPGMTGEQRFEVTEAIYQKHGYHPIQAMMSGASFLVMLPVLISSVLLFTDHPSVAGQSFLFIQDLGAPDRLLPGGLNLLPFLMFGITTADALIRFKSDRRSQFRFLIISVVLLVLVYAMPAALVLYWIGNSIAALVISQLWR